MSLQEKPADGPGRATWPTTFPDLKVWRSRDDNRFYVLRRESPVPHPKWSSVEGLSWPTLEAVQEAVPAVAEMLGLAPQEVLQPLPMDQGLLSLYDVSGQLLRVAVDPDTGGVQLQSHPGSPVEQALRLTRGDVQQLASALVGHLRATDGG